MKWYNKKILCIPVWVIALAVLIAAAGYAQQQLISYYPLPYGEYKEIKARDTLEIKKRLQAITNPTMGVINQNGLDIDLSNKTYPIKASALADIDNRNYGIDPTTISRIKHIQVDYKIDLGMTGYEGWPLFVKSGDNSYLDSTPPIPAAANAKSMKLYYGTRLNPSKAATIKVDLPSPYLKDANYFVGISPRQLSNLSDSSLPLLPAHNHGVMEIRKKNPHIGLSTHNESSQAYFKYYEVTNIAKTTAYFEVTFAGSVPKEFDWIVIGY